MGGNHGVAMWGRSSSGFASMPGMDHLIFVATRMQIRMEAYPMWCVVMRDGEERALRPVSASPGLSSAVPHPACPAAGQATCLPAHEGGFCAVLCYCVRQGGAAARVSRLCTHIQTHNSQPSLPCLSL